MRLLKDNPERRSPLTPDEQSRSRVIEPATIRNRSYNAELHGCRSAAGAAPIIIGTATFRAAPNNSQAFPAPKKPGTESRFPRFRRLIVLDSGFSLVLNLFRGIALLPATQDAAQGHQACSKQRHRTRLGDNRNRFTERNVV